MDKKTNSNNLYHVCYIHQNGTTEGEKSFKKEKDAHLYAKELAGAESSDILLMNWNDQKKHLEVILDMSIRCSEKEFLVYLKGIGIAEEEIQSKVNKYEEVWNIGNSAVIETPSGERDYYYWTLAFDFTHGLHWVLALN